MHLNDLSNAVDDIFHVNYETVVDQSIIWTEYVTGCGLDDRLEQFSRRESPEDKDQRVNLTVHISKSISNKVANPFRKSYRSSDVKRKIVGPKASDLRDLIDTFHDGQTFTELLEETYLRLNMTNPESYLLMEVERVFDNNIERPELVIREIPSENVLNYKYNHGKLVSLTFRSPVVFEVDNKEVVGFEFIQIDEQNIIVLTPIDEKTVSNTSAFEILTEQSEFFYNKNLYRVTFSENTLGYVPAKKPGYIPSIKTRGTTTDAIIDVSLPYYEKLLTRNSESDLNQQLHAYAQKAGYLPRCTEKGCINGEKRNGGNCDVCDGSGFTIPSHTSSQDFIAIPMPKAGEDTIDISQVFQYIKTDIEILEYQDKKIDSLEEKIFECIFNNDIFSKVRVTETATETNSKKDNVNDTLYAFFKGFAQTWVFFVRTLANYNTISDEDVSIDYLFSNDFKLETLDELIANFKKAVESGAPSVLVNEISKNIASKINGDDAREMERFAVVQRLNPFSGESSELISNKIATGFVDANDLFLYANLNTVISALEIDDPDWFVSPFEDIRALVIAKVRELRGTDFNTQGG